MGNSNGRSCGSIQAGEYGQTGFSPAEEVKDGKFKLRVAVWRKGRAAVEGKDEVKASPAVAEVKDKNTGTVTTDAKAAVVAAPAVKAVSEIKEGIFWGVEHKEHKTHSTSDIPETAWSEDAEVGSILAGLLYKLDKQLTEAKEEYEKAHHEWEEKKAAHDKEEEKKADKATRVKYATAAPVAREFEDEAKQLQEFKAGWFFAQTEKVAAVVGADESKSKPAVEAKVTVAPSTELAKTVKAHKITSGQTIVFVSDGIVKAHGLDAPAKPAAAATGTASS